MHVTYRQLSRALDDIEGLASDAAFPGAGGRMEVLEQALDAYLEAGLPHPHIECEATAEVMWKLFMRLRAAIEQRDKTGVYAAASDLKRELASHEHARDPGHSAVA